MPFSASVGSIDTRTSVGAQPYTGVGFQPKALLLFGGGATALDTDTADSMVCIGAASGPTERWACSIYSRNNGDERDRRISDAVVCTQVSDEGAVLYEADLDSFDADGFTLDWTTAPASARKLAYLALGGTQVTDVKAGTVLVTTAGGAVVVNDVGFQPDMVIIVAVRDSSANGNGTGHGLSVGAYDGSSQCVVTISGVDGADSQTARRLETDQLVSFYTPGTSTAVLKATISARDGNGFTLDVSVAPPADVRLHYLAVKGGTWQVGFDTAPGSATTKQTATSFEPLALLLASVMSPAAVVVNDENYLSVGGADGAAQGSQGVVEYVDASRQNTSDTKIQRYVTGTFHVANLQSFDATPGFTLNWTAVGAGNRFFFVAAGEGDEPPPDNEELPVPIIAGFGAC